MEGHVDHMIHDVREIYIDEGAAGLYERMGFQLTGLIPDYALKPHGGLTGTLIYWKRLQV